jgi:hypothetical protein
MSPNQFVGFLEELIDIKIRNYAETQVKARPEVSRLLQEKREEDRRRVEEIRRELVAVLER